MMKKKRKGRKRERGGVDTEFAFEKRVCTHSAYKPRGMVSPNLSGQKGRMASAQPWQHNLLPHSARYI